MTSRPTTDKRRKRRLTDDQWADALANAHAARSLRAAHGHYPGRFSGAAWLAKVRAMDHRCWYCHRRFPLRKLTVEHLFPISRPGHRGDIHSVVPACYRCNQRRGNRDLATFLAFMDAQQHPVAPPQPTRKRHHGPHNRSLKRLRRLQASGNRKEAA